MAPELAPGRVGNLTAVEHEKLQEMWTSLARVCNMPLDEDDKAGNASPQTSAAGQSREVQQILKLYSPEEIRQTIWAMLKMDHPDAMLLRFLRARKWDVDKALGMLLATMDWRKRQVRIRETIIGQGEAVAFKDQPTKDEQGFMEQYRIGKSFMHGVDKEGRPICIIRTRLHRPGAQTNKALEDYTVHTIETTHMTVQPPVDTAILIFDMTGFGLRNMDNAPILFLIKCFEANYPESLGLVAVHKAPWIFQGLWKLIRGWLDPVVANKILFTNTADDLAQYIPRQNILKEFGGDDDWEYKYEEPVPGENAKLEDTATREKIETERAAIANKFEANTREWLKFKPGDEQAAQLVSERNAIAEQLRDNYWRLDPYVRARTLYDRTGVIKGGGVTDFYPYRTATNGGAEVAE